MAVMNLHHNLATLSIYLLTIVNLIIIYNTYLIWKNLVSTLTSILAELGPAQPQLVLCFFVFTTFLFFIEVEVGVFTSLAISLLGLAISGHALTNKMFLGAFMPSGTLDNNFTFIGFFWGIRFHFPGCLHKYPRIFLISTHLSPFIHT